AADIDVVVFLDVVAAVGTVPRTLQVGCAVRETRRGERRQRRELFQPAWRAGLSRRIARVEALPRDCVRGKRQDAEQRDERRACHGTNSLTGRTSMLPSLAGGIFEAICSASFRSRASSR